MKAVDSNQRLGLALSGGGFRASFFHIGVLARMAEMGMLKHVESISTVSGGSIVGAAYYLLLKELLESKTDQEITDADYVALVQHLESHFLAAVQHNLAMRTFANPFKNMRMVMPNYSRSDTIGELYERIIYRPLIDVGERRIRMSDLLIQPKNMGQTFHPWDSVLGNPRRRHKVPVLILNATSLNSGHSWHFTAMSMGEEPPRNANFRDIDKKDRYRRVRYEDITTRKPYFLLGNAVAASACVPGLFPPLAVSNLYQDCRVQLVDGGVFDNQGIAGLFDPDCLCTDFIVSDAAGQADASDNPKTDLLSVLATSSSILAGRVREEMVNNLMQTQAARTAYFHLTRGLFARDIEYNNQPGVIRPSPVMSTGLVSSTTFEVAESAQRELSKIRTDLDSFTDVEAGCLAADGYQMSAPQLAKLKQYTAAPVADYWQFSRYRPLLKEGDSRMLDQLALARHQYFKPLLYALKGVANGKQSLGLALVSLPAIASLVLIVWLINQLMKDMLGIDFLQIMTSPASFQQFLFDIAPAVYFLLIALVLSKIADVFYQGSGKWLGWLHRILKGPLALITVLAIRIVLPAVFAIPVIIYLHTIDKYFIKVMGKY